MDLYIEHALERTVRIAFSGQELGKSPVCSEADCTHFSLTLPVPPLGAEGDSHETPRDRGHRSKQTGQFRPPCDMGRNRAGTKTGGSVATHRQRTDQRRACPAVGTPDAGRDVRRFTTCTSGRKDAAGSPEGTERLASPGAHGRPKGGVPECMVHGGVAESGSRPFRNGSSQRMFRIPRCAMNAR